jgi:RNA polymerase sigma-70 factor (ECF subfamily)
VGKEPLSTTASDKHLVEAAIQGDAGAFGVLMERYWNTAVALVLSRIEDSCEAEDVAQECFVKAYLHLSKLRDRSCFAGWLSKIVLQECVNYVRTARRRKKTADTEKRPFEQLVAMAAVSVNPGIGSGEIETVRQSVRRLPERYKSVVVMRFVGGLDTREIARQLGEREGTVRVWLHRAYEMLRKELAPILEEVE